MLHTFLSPPFADAARQAQFEALQATLAAELNAPVSLLLGNFAVKESGAVFDAVLVRPHSVSVVLFVPRGGLLVIPPQGAGSWLLDEHPIRLLGGTPTPFAQFRRLKEELVGWLGSQLGSDRVAPELITGLVVFAEPVTFGSGVEQFLRTQPGADSLLLLSNLRQLPRQLVQIAHPDIQLSAEELTLWAQDVAAEHPETTADEGEELEAAMGFWEQKARQLWRWLGAEDVPHDAPYGDLAAMAANNEEKQQLEQMRQQIRVELAQQRQEMEAREAEREKNIEMLRAQLIQVPAAATHASELQARLDAETREKADLEQAILASRTEAAVRNQELDARIQQLGQLIEQFQVKPPITPSSSSAVKPPVAKPKHNNLLKRPTAQLRWPRVAVVIGAAVGIGLGAWGLTKLIKEKENTPARTSSVEAPEASESTYTQPSSDALTDTITREIAAVSDSATTEGEASEVVTTEPLVTTAADSNASQETLYQPPTNPEEPGETDSTSIEE